MSILPKERFEVVRPRGELDAATVSELRDAFAGLDAVGRVVIDLGEVSFVDSAGLGGLVGGIRSVRERGGDVVISSARRPVARMLRTAGVDRLVEMVPDLETALSEGPGAGGPGAGLGR